MPALSVIVITRNEEGRIRRALGSVTWADEIVVVDSESTDGTARICREFTASVMVRPFDDFATQKNAALDRARGEWVLSVDADEVVSPELAREIRQAISDPRSPHAAYLVRRENYLCGVPIRHVWGTDHHVRLFRRGQARFVNTVHEKVTVEGSIGRLTQPLLHYNSESLREYLAKNALYTSLEARVRYERGERSSVVKLALSPVRVLFFRLVRLRGYRDGLMGFALSGLLAFFVFQVHRKSRQLVARERKARAPRSAGA